MRSFFLLHVAVLVCAMPAMAQNPLGTQRRRTRFTTLRKPRRPPPLLWNYPPKRRS